MAGNAPLREPIGIIDKQAGVVRLNPVWERYFTRTLQPDLESAIDSESVDFESILFGGGDDDKINNLEKLLYALFQPQSGELRQRVENLETEKFTSVSEPTEVISAPNKHSNRAYMYALIL